MLASDKDCTQLVVWLGLAMLFPFYLYYTMVLSARREARARIKIVANKVVASTVVAQSTVSGRQLAPTSRQILHNATEKCKVLLVSLSPFLLPSKQGL